MRSYLRRLHLASIVALAVLTVGFGLGGWLLRPASNGFPTVPGNLVLLVGSAGWGNFTETLTHTSGNGAVLTVFGLPTGSHSKDWVLWVDHPGPVRLCTPHDVTVGDLESLDFFTEPSQRLVPAKKATQRLTPFLPEITVAGAYAVEGSGNYYVRLCWSSGAPVSVAGAYLSAVFPPMLSYGDETPFTVTRQLNLGAPDSADFAVQSLVQPSSVTPGGWQWKSVVPGPSSLSFTAVDTTETQHDSYQAFLSGIAFGVAGGAFVSLVLELLDPFRTRRQRVEPAPSD
jgi:hypothetical protein